VILLITWSEINPKHFEKFIYYTLSKIGFTNREWFGRGGGDRGRDIVGTTFERLPFNLGYERKWIFQCKKWAKMPPKNMIINEILAASQHSPDFWVLVIPIELTSSQLDYINHLNNNYEFKIIVMPLAAIEEILHDYPETINILINGSLIEGSTE
jgi:hypothetical protein